MTASSDTPDQRRAMLERLSDTTPAPPGVVILDKPGGMTSHDVVNIVRRRTGCRQVGHAGTLDPMATGVLVVCVGSATRLMEYLRTDPKAYEAAVVFGIETDTLDVTGSVTRTHNVGNLTYERIEKALTRFSGTILQVPPMVSARHVGGRRLYELARRGIEVERPLTEVTVHSLTLHTFTQGPPPAARLTVVCSAGTYIRTLAADLGKELGCGGALAELRRTRAGRFWIEDAVALDGPLALMPIEAALDTLPMARLDAQAFRHLRHGRMIPAPPELVADEGSPVLACGPGHSYAIVARTERMLRPVKVLSRPEDAA